MDPHIITEAILDFLRQAPQRRLPGALLGNKLQRHFGRSPREIGVGKLVDFVESHLANEVDIQRDGLLVTYSLRDEAAPSAFTHTSTPTSSASSHDPPDLWRIWRSPRSGYRLAVRHDDGSVRALDRDASPTEGETMLTPPSSDGHIAIAERFVEQQVPEPHRGAFRSRIKRDDPKWWLGWDELFRDLGLAPLRAAWMRTRSEELVALLREAVSTLGVPEAVQQAVVSNIKTTRAKPSDTKTEPRPRTDLRAALLVTIQRLSEEELRQVWVPAGLLYDAFNSTR